MFENFTLSENIAGDCGVKIHTLVEDTCAYETTGGIAYFTYGLVKNCEYDAPSDDFDGICYHNPTDTARLFNS